MAIWNRLYLNVTNVLLQNFFGKAPIVGGFVFLGIGPSGYMLRYFYKKDI